MKVRGKLFVVIILLFVPVFIILNYACKNTEEKPVLVSTKKVEKSEMLSIYIEDDIDSGNYIDYDDKVFEENDYILNEELTKCMNGSKILYDPETKYIKIESLNSDRCYVFFDRYDYVSLENIEVEIEPNRNVDITVTSNRANAIQGYYYSINNGNWVSGTNQEVFSDTINGNKYNVKVKALDNNGTYSKILNKTFDIYEVVYVCEDCTFARSSDLVFSGDSASVRITADSGYTLEDATITGDGCTLDNDTLEVGNVTKNTVCYVTAKKEETYTYTTPSGQVVSSEEELKAILVEPGNFVKEPTPDNPDAEPESCLFYNDGIYCIGSSSWEGDLGVPDDSAGSQTMDNMKDLMEQKFNVQASSCYSNAWSVGCYFNQFYCNIDFNGLVCCSDGRHQCYVYANGDVRCN